MPGASQFVKDAAVSGALAATALALAAAFAGRRSTGSYAAAANATSHIVWGTKALRRNAVTWKYTGTGLLANLGGALFWSILYEALRARRRPRTPSRALADGAAVAATAYLVDYHVVPQRFTPGFEHRLPGRALPGLYAAFALGLALRELLQRAETPPPCGGGAPPR